MPAPASLAERLASYGQQHLVAFWDQLDDAEQSRLEQQISRVDFDQVRELWQSRNQAAGMTGAEQAARAKPPQDVIRQPRTDEEWQQWQAAYDEGERLLAAGQVATVVVAGGQGTRLGFDKPKGMFRIGPVSGAFLFQILAEQVLARSRRAGRPIPYLVMTSDATESETEAFFEQQNYFGLNPNQMFFFKQGNMPAVNADNGRLLLDSPCDLALSPDGHGGILEALKRSGGLDWLADQGIEYLHYHQVDNPTAIICDPAFLGWHALRKADVSTKVVAKVSPTEKMGVVCDVDGVTQIIEYSDLPGDLAAKTDEKGDPIFWAGNTAIHVFSRTFLDKQSSGAGALPFHLANKAVPFIDADGGYNQPLQPNAIKFERFIFDTLPLAATPLVVEADRRREFNPVKNAQGNDSPATSQAAIDAIGKFWLRSAGAAVDDGATIEISPLFALDAEELRTKIDPGSSFTGDVYLR